MRAALLQAAMCGELTKRAVGDGDARDLLAAIQREKKRLVKEKKLKKEKPLPPIAAEEVPFDIPENWCWCRLGSVTTYAQPKEKVPNGELHGNLWVLDMEEIEKGTGRIR